jgi:hypothetical protein
MPCTDKSLPGAPACSPPHSTGRYLVLATTVFSTGKPFWITDQTSPFLNHLQDHPFNIHSHPYYKPIYLPLALFSLLQDLKKNFYFACLQYPTTSALSCISASFRTTSVYAVPCGPRNATSANPGLHSSPRCFWFNISSRLGNWSDGEGCCWQRRTKKVA